VAAFVNAAMAIYGPEYRPLREPGGCQPCVERGDGAPTGPAERNADLTPFAVLVGF